MNLSITGNIRAAVCILTIILSLRSDAVNADWVQVGNTNGNLVTCMIKKDNYLFAGTQGSGIYRSSDNGQNWMQVNSGLLVLSITSFVYNSLGIFASSAGGVYISLNNGDLWTQVGSGSTSGYVVSLTSNANDIYAGHILAGVFETTNNGTAWTRFALGEGDLMNTILCTGSEFFISIVNTVMRSTNGGKSWNHTVNGLLNNNVKQLSFHEEDLYAGTNSGVFYSSNRGNLWTPASKGLTDSMITALTAINDIAFAGTSQNGIFMTSDKGAQWTNVSDGLTDTGIYSLMAAEKYLFAGSFNGNIWRRDLSEIITKITLHQTESVGSYRLHQNYPNPFNPLTNISFEIPEAGKVTLKIFDSRGSEINSLINKHLSPGIYSLSFDASGLSSGIYFYEMKASGYTVSRKMVVVK